MNAAEIARFWAKVDKTAPGGCWQWTASLNTGGYGQFRADGTVRRAHRIAWELLAGPIPDGLMLDHRCFNKGCVNPGHLRLVTCKQNQEHRRGAARHNVTTGVLGVHQWADGRYYAKIRHNDRQIHLGTYLTLAEAEAARIAAEADLYTHSARVA